MKLVVVSAGHAEQLGDDRQRERKRVVFDDVHVTLEFYSVQQFVGDRLNAPLHLFDDAGREGFMNECAEATMVGLVQVEHVALERP